MTRNKKKNYYAERVNGSRMTLTEARLVEEVHRYQFRPGGLEHP